MPTSAFNRDRLADMMASNGASLRVVDDNYVVEKIPRWKLFFHKDHMHWWLHSMSLWIGLIGVAPLPIVVAYVQYKDSRIQDSLEYNRALDLSAHLAINNNVIKLQEMVAPLDGRIVELSSQVKKYGQENQELRVEVNNLRTGQKKQGQEIKNIEHQVGAIIRNLPSEIDTQIRNIMFGRSNVVDRAGS